MPAIPDSNSPAFWRDGRLYLYGSHGSPWLSVAANQFGPWETRTVSVPSADPSPKWMEAIWPESDGVIWGWYHAEMVDLVPGSTLTAPKIGAAVSYDGGYTMNDLGFVLAARDPINPAAQNGFFGGGHGDPSVILDRERKYFYFFFGNYGGPAETQGVCVARMALNDRGSPTGKVWKYYDGAWQEPGLGGRVTPIFPVRTAWGAADPDAFWGPAVHWNTHLNCYVMLLNHAAGGGWTQEGVYVSFSPDPSRPELWTEPRLILDKSQIWYPGDFYPQVIGLGPGETDRIAGQTARLYLHGISQWEIDFIAPETAPTAVMLTIGPASAVVSAGQPAQFTVTAMGRAPFTYQWLKDGVPILQANASTYEIPAVTAADAGVYAVMVTNALGSSLSNSVALALAAPVLPPRPHSFLSNLAVRSWLPTDEAALTIGFVLRSATPKPVLLRAIGPSLGLFGVTDAAADTRLSVFDGAGNVLGENDDWQPADATTFAAAGAFPLPDGSADSALVATPTSTTTTARVTATGGGSVLAEIYDPAATPGSKMVNLSARALVGTDGHSIVGGFTVSGSGDKRLLIRALGPQLAVFGVDQVLANPVLEVYDQAGSLVASDDDWNPALESAFAEASAMPLPVGSRDAAVVVTLTAGAGYTVVLRSGDGSTGEALLEIYELP